MIHRNSLSAGPPCLAAFLAQNGVIGIVLADDLDDFELGLRIDLGDEVVLTLGAHVETVEPIHAADDDFTGTARGANGDIEQRLHGDEPRDRAERKASGSW